MDEMIRRAYRNYQSEGTKQSYAIYLQIATRGEQPVHCFFCKNLVPTSDLWDCVECRAASCHDCSVDSLVCADADCRARDCPDCAEPCPICEKKMCPGDHDTACSECYEESCLECSAYCEDCGDQYCRNHMDFGTFVCNDCSEHGGDLGYHRNPRNFDSDEGAFLDQCSWVELMHRPLRYEQCPNSVMTGGFCHKHYRLWQNLERSRILDEEGYDIWGEADAETRFNEKPRRFW